MTNQEMTEIALKLFEEHLTVYLSKYSFFSLEEYKQKFQQEYHMRYLDFCAGMLVASQGKLNDSPLD